MSVENTKHSQFNRIRDIIYNEDNKLKHMDSIEKMVRKFEDDFGTCKLSKSLWSKYKVINNVLINNK